LDVQQVTLSELHHGIGLLYLALTAWSASKWGQVSGVSAAQALDWRLSSPLPNGMAAKLG